MPGSDAIHVCGTVVKVLPSRLLLVELANGHRVLGYAARRNQERVAGMAVGVLVELEMTPFDMSKARILV